MSTEAPALGQVRVEPSAKRVRAYFAGVAVADTTRPVLVWEQPYYPTYYLPAADVRMDLLHADTDPGHSPVPGDAQVFSLAVDSRVAKAAALRYPHSPTEELRDLIRFEWDAIDAWFEEDEEIFTHPRDPYHRVDILPSSRRVRVEVDGVAVADSASSQMLFETGLPVRYYLPKTHVRMDLLTPTDTVSHCPYKGQAQYWSVAGHPDLAWSYTTPLPESARIASLVAFYNEKLDIYVDGALQERPKSPFS